MMELTNIYYSPKKFYSIRFPASWKCLNEEECLSIFNSDYPGAITVSSYGGKKRANAYDDLARLLKKTFQIEEYSKIRRGENSARMEIEHNGTFWIYQISIKNRNLFSRWTKKVLVTFNCNMAQKHFADFKTIEAIIQSLKIS